MLPLLAGLHVASLLLSLIDGSIHLPIIGSSSPYLTWRRKCLCSALTMKIFSRVLVSLFVALACMLATAEPASWYKWRSKLDGAFACSQTPLGTGWDRIAGPYRDSRCEKPAIAK
jgi:hypothetical protein